MATETKDKKVVKLECSNIKKIMHFTFKPDYLVSQFWEAVVILDNTCYTDTFFIGVDGSTGSMVISPVNPIKHKYNVDISDDAITFSMRKDTNTKMSIYVYPVKCGVKIKL